VLKRQTTDGQQTRKHTASVTDSSMADASKHFYCAK